ncbi:Protein N-acetyltransferase, RimJ/RimL family [Paenibacillus sp. 1_12]|uniref:GNAT family N-acetyltransferase n=1 Tax=Paenibacillus sp. 1_12 TaxID=1566278 RepID=UPI0008DEB27B|nr:GNAT family protein [Paenibacillus sp. 1_12]SFL53337.1 Protein N-acetyltransferase, RimJ/RimL family [Paenibacillus sp. 1_12]
MNGSKVNLRAFESEDMKELHHWLNDADSIALVGRVPRTYEETVHHVEKKRKNGDLVLAIENEELELIGWTFLQNIEYEHGRASIGILIAPEYRGHGYAGMAMKKMIDIGFKQLRLNKIYLTTRGINERAIGLYQKTGFIIEGQLRNHAFSDGQYYDTYFMGILASEWKG